MNIFSNIIKGMLMETKFVFEKPIINSMHGLFLRFIEITRIKFRQFSIVRTKIIKVHLLEFES